MCTDRSDGKMEEMCGTAGGSLSQIFEEPGRPVMQAGGNTSNEEHFVELTALSLQSIGTIF